jgi:hypothetical protein
LHEKYPQRTHAGASVATLSGSPQGQSFRPKAHLPIYDGTTNIGDTIQTVALARLIGGPCVGVDRDLPFPNLYPEAPFVVNGWLGWGEPRTANPCVFAGVHLGHKEPEYIAWMREGLKPVGARDSYTLGLLKSHGVEAELVGCATLTLPRYEGPRKGRYSIDVDREPDTVVLTSEIPRLTWAEEWETALRRLELLRKAEIVYSSRIHVILPCLAFGTPVAFPTRSFKGLFDKSRLGILHDIGFVYDRPVQLDVSQVAARFKAFLGGFLNFPLEEGSWPPPAPMPIVGRTSGNNAAIARSRSLQAKTRTPPAQFRKLPSVSVMVITRNGAERLSGCLESIQASGFADEIVVCVDRRSTDSSVAVARQFTSNVNILDADAPSVDWAYGRVAESCKGDFVLYLDDDELLGGDWDRDRFQRWVAYNGLTHFWIPRRWIVPGERFIAEPPWHPDLQMRLFRNDSRLITWPTQIHERVEVQGGSVVWPDGWIEHRNLVMTTREEREEKCRRYRSERPDHHLSEMYLYEDRQLATLPREAGPEALFTAGIQDAEWVSPEPYQLGSEIDFRESGNSTNFAPVGWSNPEPWGRWTSGELAEICLRLDRPLEKRATFRASVRPHVYGSHRRLDVEIYFGNRLLKKLAFRTRFPRTIRVAIPAGWGANESRVRIGIRVLNPRSPLSLGEANDARQLGLAFVRASLG